MTFETFYNLFMITCFGITMFNLGQAYAVSREIREDSRRHSELISRISRS